MAEASDGRDITAPRGASWTHGFDAVGKIGALFTFEIDMKESLIAPWRYDLACDHRQRRAAEILDKPQIRRERKLLDRPGVALGIAIIGNAPNFSLRID